MGLVLFLTSFLLLATSSFARHQVAKQGHKPSTLHFTLYHVLGHNSPLGLQSPPSISELLYRDRARIKHLNSRLTRNKTSTNSTTSHKSEKLFGPKLTTTSLDLDLFPGVGNYYVSIGLGTPPTYYRVILDTGSSLSWLQCSDQVGPFFDPSASSTFQSVPCTTPQCNAIEDATQNPFECSGSNACLYTASYVDGSSSTGYLIQDSLTLSQSETLSGFVCGCAQDKDGFSSQFAGLFGLGRNELSMLSQLSVKYGKAFSYCLPSPTGNRGGSLSIGSGALMGPSYKFTPMVTISGDDDLYYVSLTAIQVADRTLRVPAKYNLIVLDSGTEITRLPMILHAFLRIMITQLISVNHNTAPAMDIFDTCFLGSVKEMSYLPEIRLVFQGGADLTLTPESFLYDVDDGITCLAFAPNLDDNDMAIIGNFHQQRYRIAYDVTNSRIGFAAEGCS